MGHPWDILNSRIPQVREEMARALASWSAQFASRSDLMPSLLRLLIQAMADPSAEVSAIATQGTDLCLTVLNLCFSLTIGSRTLYLSTLKNT